MRRAVLLLITATAIALTASSARAMMLITADPGGLITEYAERFLTARATGERVVIDGACLSACTLVVGMMPRDRICATPKAVLGFHSAWLPRVDGGKINSLAASTAMMEIYPAELRRWIARRGGLGTKMMFLQGRELAQIVPPCGTSVSAAANVIRNPHVLRSDTNRTTFVARQTR